MLLGRAVGVLVFLVFPGLVAAQSDVLVVGDLRIDAPVSVVSNYPAMLERLRQATDSGGSEPVRLLVHRPGVLAIPGNVFSAMSRPEAFWVTTDSARREIRLLAATDAGIVQGINRLTLLLEADRGRLDAGELLDWPVHPVRAFHVTLRGVNPRMLRQVIDQIVPAGFNTLVVQISDAVDFDHPAILPREDAMSADVFMGVVDYARGRGLRVIPEVKLLSHQKKFLAPTRPDLLYNAVTYDPRNDQVYELVFSYLETLISIMQPDAVHIGHDEIRGFTARQRERYLRPGEAALPPELFRADVERLHGWLTERAIEVWMWGDMLLAPEEFPRMRERHLHGNMAYAALRAELPRDIVICDWHYRDEVDFASLQAFVDEGYPVLGATWKAASSTRAFSRAAAAMEPRPAGMMATSWWHLRRRDWQTMDSIIADSGEAFWSNE